MIKILLADDHKLMRSGLLKILEKEADFEVVAEAESGRQAIELVHESNPLVVLMDVSMPDMSGITATSRICAEFPEIKILGLSMHPSEKLACDMINAGASGYMTKNSTNQELVKAIRLILGNQRYLSPEISSSFVDNFLNQESRKSSGEKFGTPLSKREKEVLQLVAEGKPSKAIASELSISEKTVGAHRQNITEKLGVRSIAELTKYAIQQGLTSLE